MPTKPDGKTVELEGYKILLQHIQYEGNLIWARTTAFLTINAGWFAFLSSKATGSSGFDKVVSIYGPSIGILLSLTWFCAAIRARKYYRHWWKKLKEIEEHLPFDFFRTGGQLFEANNEKRWIYRLGRRFLGVSDLHPFLSFLTVVGWAAWFIFKLCSR